MKVLINDSDLEITGEEIPTFGQVVEEAERHASAEGKIITEIMYNGELITPDDEAARGRCCCEGSDTIAMRAESPARVIVRALKEAESDIPGLVENLRKVAEHLQTGARQAAFSLFSDCIERWKQVINLFRIVQSVLGVNTQEIMIEGRSLDHIQGELLALLVETRKSMQDDDAIALSDLLEYELVPSIEGQKEITRKLIDLAEAME